jgi:hypothetical protein
LYGVGGAPPERGIVRWGDRFTTVDYPPIALYELAIAGTLYSIAEPSFRDTPWLSATMKALPLAAELALALVLWRAIRRIHGEAVAEWAVVAFWANPAMILAGSGLGYLDALMTLPALAAIVAASSGSAVQAGVLIAIACLTKAQAVFIVPVVGLAAWQTRGPRGVGFTAAGAAIAAALALAPFALAGAWGNLLQGVGSLLRHDMLSADAANLWGLVTLRHARHLRRTRSRRVGRVGRAARSTAGVLRRERCLRLEPLVVLRICPRAHAAIEEHHRDRCDGAARGRQLCPARAVRDANCAGQRSTGL